MLLVEDPLPLIILTPKSLLRLAAATSLLEELADGHWHPVLDDTWAAPRAGQIRRLVLCTGKIYYDLLAEAEKMKERRPAIVRIEQLYSFPWQEIRVVLARYQTLEEMIWAQEEPRNMGAWIYLRSKLAEVLPHQAELRYVGRPERASPAEGYPAAHAAEQARIVAEALGTVDAREAGSATTAAAGEAKG